METILKEKISRSGEFKIVAKELDVLEARSYYANDKIQHAYTVNVSDNNNKIIDSFTSTSEFDENNNSLSQVLDRFDKFYNKYGRL